MVRISGGTVRGQVLQVPPDNWLRPTMGRVREAMFSMLAPQMPGATLLDLFAGCGLLGLEALSRGAQSAFFVDLEPKAVQLIKKNVTLCGMDTRALAQQGSALHKTTLKRIKHLADQHHGHHRAFDLVFLDPPYRQGLVASTLQVLAHMAQSEIKFLAPEAIVVTEQEANIKTEPLASWHCVKNKRYGDTRIIFWRWLPT